MCTKHHLSLSSQIATLSRDEQPGSLVDRVFKLSLSEFHTSLISSYSLTLQVSTILFNSTTILHYGVVSVRILYIYLIPLPFVLVVVLYLYVNEKC